MMTKKEQDTLDTLRRAKATVELHVNYFMELANDTAVSQLKPEVLADSLEAVSSLIELAQKQLES